MILDASIKIVEEVGVKKLRIREIAKRIGYTSGTLYLIFKDLDELIAELHIRTLEELYAQLSHIKFDGDSESNLLKLAEGYRTYTHQNPRRWNALFEHTMDDGKRLPERYDRAIFQLIDLAVVALRPLYPPDSDTKVLHDARVLWASFYGILALDASNKLSRYEPASDFVTSLVKNYVAGIRVNQPK